MTQGGPMALIDAMATGSAPISPDSIRAPDPSNPERRLSRDGSKCAFKLVIQVT